jgi:hypothetical protein
MASLQGFDIDSCIVAAGIGGVGVLEYAALDELDTESFEPTTDADYVFRRAISATWRPLPFVIGTGGYTEEAQPAAQGTTFRAAVSVFMPGDSAEQRNELNRMRHRRFLLRMTGRDGRLLLLGTIEQPLRFESRFATGPAGDAQRGYNCTFSGAILTKSPQYTPTW